MKTTTRKPTRQQAAVARELTSSRDFTSAQDLHARMRAGGSSVGLATVYRTLTTLAAEGEVDVLRTDEGESVYRACSSGHHHHLV
ncbi:MAG: transcriptional repressor, partial [Ornithinimicrobium sp.]